MVNIECIADNQDIFCLKCGLLETNIALICIMYICTVQLSKHTQSWTWAGTFLWNVKSEEKNVNTAWLDSNIHKSYCEVKYCSRHLSKCGTQCWTIWGILHLGCRTICEIDNPPCIQAVHCALCNAVGPSVKLTISHIYTWQIQCMQCSWIIWVKLPVDHI